MGRLRRLVPAPVRGRARLVHGWLGVHRDTIVVLLIAVAFLWLGRQQLENHSTAKLAHGTAVEAKGTAEEAKSIAIVSHTDAERLDEVTAAAAQAYCKLKLYDELSGTTSSHLFARLGVLPPQVARGVRDALRLVESIKSPKMCDTATSVPTSPRSKHRGARASGITSTAIERQLRRIEQAPAPERAPGRPPTARISPPRPKPAPRPAPSHPRPPARPQTPPAAKPAPKPGPPPPRPGPHPTPPGPHIEVEIEAPGLGKACVNAGPAEHNPHCQGVGVGL